MDMILEKMSKAESIDDLLEAYLKLDKQAIFAILAFAADCIKNQKVYSTAS